MPAAPPLWSETEEIPSWSDTTEIVDERLSRGESSDFVEPPPQPVFTGEIPEEGGGIPPRLTDAEWERVRKQSALGEEIAGTMAEAEITGRAARIFESNLPRDLLAPTSEDALKEGAAFRAANPELDRWNPSPFRPPSTVEELSPNTRESLAAGEALSGTVADLSSADQALVLGAAALTGGVPGTAGRILGAAAPATFGVEGVKSIYEGGKTLLSDDATPEQRGQAKTQIGLGVTMLPGLGALVKRPAIPPRIIETIAKADAIGLKRAAQAYADTVKREPISDRPQQLEQPIEKGIPDASHIEETAPLEKPGEVAPVAQSAEAVPRKPARAQGESQPEVLLTGPEVIKSIEALPDAEAGRLGQKPAVEAGMKLTPADVPDIKRASEEAFARSDAAGEAKDYTKAQAEMGRGIYFNALIEGANRKGPNYNVFIEQQKALPEPAGPKVNAGGEQPTPAASQAVKPRAAAASAAKAQPELPGTYTASAKVIADKLRAQFKTDTGGKTFTGPVEIINAAVEVAAKVIEYGGSAADAMAAALKHIRTNWKGEFDEAAFRTRFDEAIKVPDTAGENVKMRKSAERATEAPMIPEPVQERIEAAPESRYAQQSMKRVEDAVKTMTDAELAAMPAESNLFVASKLEQADRRFRAGDNDGGYQIFVELEKQGTSFGQNINQFKRLAGTRPEYVATVIDKKLTRAGKDPLTEAQRATAIETARQSKEADAALDRATDAWEAKPTDANAAKAEATLDAANSAALDLQKFIAKFEPRSTSAVIKSVLQGNLLTPISEVANLFGNMSFLPFRMGERGIATGLDIIDAAIRGKPRELSVQPLAGTAEALKGVGRGLKQIPSILIEGTGNVIKGETRVGLHPIKAWINQFAKNPEMPTTGGKLTLQDRLNLAIEGTFGVPAEAMLRGLGAGDVPFKEAARARVTAEQLKLNNVPRENWAFAQKFPELFLPKEALQQIHKDAMAAVFQRESKTLNLLTNFLRGKGEIIDLLAATVAPYKLTPWNIIGEILSYNPLIAMSKTALDARAGNSRGAKLNAGKMVVGSMLTGAGIWLYKNGLLAPSLDERDEAQKARVLSQKVLPPNHINISGLKRKMEGGDPSFQAGDETADVFRAGGLAGAMFYMTANIGRDMERGPKATDADMWKSIIRQSTLEQARFGLNQSFLSGVEGLLTAIKDGNADNYLRQWANTVTSIGLPNTLNTISRASRKYQVDLKADDFKGKLTNIVKSKLGLDDYLPLKRDFWGKPMPETPEGRDAIFYHFFDITKNKQVTSDPVELELYRLWRKTGDAAVIPSLPQRILTLERSSYALDPKQYERYAELVGENRRNIVDALVINPQFHKETDERKMNFLDRAYRDGLARGKALFYLEFQGKLTPKAGRVGFEPSTPNPNP